MRLRRPYALIPLASTLTCLQIDCTPQLQLPKAFACILPVKALQSLAISGLRIQPQELEMFSPCHFQTALPQLKELSLSDIWLGNLHPFPQLKQPDNLSLDLTIMWSSCLWDNLECYLESYRYLKEITPRSLSILGAENILPIVLKSLTVEHIVKLSASRALFTMSITVTPRCRELHLCAHDMDIEWTCLFEHAYVVHITGSCYLHSFDSLPKKPFWIFSMYKPGGWAHHEEARALLEAYGSKGYYEEVQQGQHNNVIRGHCIDSRLTMGSVDAAPLQNRPESAMWSVL